MSRIGKNPVQIPTGVTVTLNEKILITKGKLGELKLEIHPRMKVVINENEVVVERPSDEKFDKGLHGLTRTLIANNVHGVSEGFEKKLEIQGVGYRAAGGGKKLTLTLGFSHPVEVIAPEGITFELDEKNKNLITVKGIDKQLVGEISARIRGYRPPEPYKGKGVRYVGEYVARKAGKTAAKAG